jgi:hypothetical protein
MQARDLANSLATAVKELKNQGHQHIAVDNLLDYLNKFQSGTEPNDTDVERYKAQLQVWVEDRKNLHVSNVEMFRSVIAAGQNAIRSAFILNGGAAVAMLAFIGHLVSVNISKIPIFADSILPFTAGVLGASVAAGFTYLSQWCYANETPNTVKIGNVIRVVCILLVLGAYGCFVLGMYSVYQAVLNF